MRSRQQKTSQVSKTCEVFSFHAQMPMSRAPLTTSVSQQAVFRGARMVVLLASNVASSQCAITSAVCGSYKMVVCVASGMVAPMRALPSRKCDANIIGANALCTASR